MPLEDLAGYRGTKSSREGHVSQDLHSTRTDFAFEPRTESEVEEALGSFPRVRVQVAVTLGSVLLLIPKRKIKVVDESSEGLS